MNTAYDVQSLQAYGLRLQTQARRPLPRELARTSRGLSPRLRALVHGRTS